MREIIHKRYVLEYIWIIYGFGLWKLLLCFGFPPKSQANVFEPHVAWNYFYIYKTWRRQGGFKLISRMVKLSLFNTYISMKLASVKHFIRLHKAYIFKWDLVRWVNSKLGKLKHKTDCSTLSLFYEAFVGNAWWSFLLKSSYFPILYSF